MVGLEHKCKLCGFEAITQVRLLHHITGYHSWPHSALKEMEEALYSVVMNRPYGGTVWAKTNEFPGSRKIHRFK